MIEILEKVMNSRGHINYNKYFVEPLNFNLFRRFITSERNNDELTYINYNGNTINVCRVNDGLLEYYQYSIVTNLVHNREKITPWVPDNNATLIKGVWFNSIDELIFRLEDYVGNIEILDKIRKL